MRQKDIASLVLVIAISLIASWIVFNALINTPENRETEVERVDAFSGEFPEPDSTIFNKNALNPTELIRIGESETSEPF